jgi:four helix bundle protein
MDKKRTKNMKKEARGFRTLNTWKKAYEFALEIYRLFSQKFSKRGDLHPDIATRRAADSVSANISEGYERNHQKHISSFRFSQKAHWERLRHISS